MFKFTLTIATSAFLFMSGTADLFAMEILDDGDGKPGNQLVIARTEDTKPDPINHMPKDLMGVIFIETSKLKNPRHLTSVCKHWYSIMREDNIPQGAELHYSAMNPFMKGCMETYWDTLHYNAILRYMPLDDNGKVMEDCVAVTSKFSGLKNTNGTFDLSACKYKISSLASCVEFSLDSCVELFVITESMDRFIKVKEQNENKTVVGIMPCHRILQTIQNAPDHPFFPLLANLDPDKASELLFWRWGSGEKLTLFDSLTTASVREISSRNLYENWRAGARDPHIGVSRCGWPIATMFHVYF